MRNQEQRTRRILLNSGRKANNLIILTFKLVLILGIVEVIGFVQIRNDNLTENEEIFNKVFAILFTICLSFRGIIMLLIYICNKQKLKLIQSKFCKKAEVLNISKETGTKSSELQSQTTEF